MKNQTQNGKKVSKNVKSENGKWGANVWFGAGEVTNVRRYYYTTKSQAQQADISDEIGKNGRIA